MTPDPKEHNPDPKYLKQLIDSSGLTKQQIADEVLGVSIHTVDEWLKGRRKFNYATQFTLESKVCGIF